MSHAFDHIEIAEKFAAEEFEAIAELADEQVSMSLLITAGFLDRYL